MALDPEQYSPHGAVYHIFVGPHPLHSPWGYLCALSVGALSGSMSGICVLNTNREIASQALFGDLEFSRCVPVGEETKRNAQVDDGLTKVK